MCRQHKRAFKVGVSWRLKVLQGVNAHCGRWEVSDGVQVKSHPPSVTVSALCTHLFIPPASLWSEIGLNTSDRCTKFIILTAIPFKMLLVHINVQNTFYGKK